MTSIYTLPLSTVYLDESNVLGSINPGTPAALEIAADSDLDACFISGPSLSERMLSVGNGIVRPGNGPFYIRSVYGGNESIQTYWGSGVNNAKLSIATHSCVPSSWNQKRSPKLWKFIGVTCNSVTWVAPTAVAIPIHGRRNVLLTLQTTAGGNAHWRVVVRRMRSNANAGLSAFLNASTAILGNGGGDPASYNWTDNAWEWLIPVCTADVPGQTATFDIEVSVGD